MQIYHVKISFQSHRRQQFNKLSLDRFSLFEYYELHNDSCYLQFVNHPFDPSIN